MNIKNILILILKTNSFYFNPSKKKFPKINIKTIHKLNYNENLNNTIK